MIASQNDKNNEESQNKIMHMKISKINYYNNIKKKLKINNIDKYNTLLGI